MNQWVPIIKNIKESIVRIVLFSEGEIVSEGTGTIINKFGWVITATHVIEMLPDYEKYKKKCLIYVFTKYGRLEYSLGSTPISIDVEVGEERPFSMDIDIAILSPILPIQFETFLTPEVDLENLEMGSDLLMCGYSEETPDLIEWSRVFNKTFSKLDDSQKDEIKILQGSLKPATYKSGILAHTMNIYANDPLLHLHYQLLHVDNGVHGGMSGGPIVNAEGQFIGIITQRTVVSSNVLSDKRIFTFTVPSGNSIGITLNILPHIKGFKSHYIDSTV